MQTDLVVNPEIRIRAEELRFSFARSSGPGGQNVNKLNTKAILHWDVVRSEGLDDGVRGRFVAKFGQRINSEGQLVLTSERTRDQRRNIEDCLAKLREMLLAVATPPKKRKPTRMSPAQKSRRLAQKRQISEKKQRRASRPSDDD